MTREEWLIQLCETFLWPLIEQHGGEKRPYRISVGFPKGSRGARGAIGQAWSPQCSADKTGEVFISPVLTDFDAAHVALHELIHVSDQNVNGHKGPFKKIAVAVGLEGKMTATVPSVALGLRIRKWLSIMPAYPHAVLKPSSETKGPGSRLLKAECAACGFTFRVTRMWAAPVLRCPYPYCDGEVYVK